MVGDGSAIASRPLPRFSKDLRFGGSSEAPPPLERPWWMKVHGDGPAVTNLEEVMDQFLCDSQAQVLESACERATKKFNVRSVDQSLPGIEEDCLESMTKWHGHVTKFLKYRSQVSEKHERQMELRMHRKHDKYDVWEGLDSDDENSGSEQDLSDVIPMPSARSVATGTGSMSLLTSNMQPTRDEAPSTASHRPSALPLRPRASQKTQPLTAAAVLLVQKTGSVRKAQWSDKADVDKAESESGDATPRTPRRGSSFRRHSKPSSIIYRSSP